MDINEFLYKNELLFLAEEYDVNFIEECIKEKGKARQRLDEVAENIEKEIKKAKEELEECKKSISKLKEEARGSVKAFAETLSNDGIWSTISSQDEKTKILRSFYKHISDIRDGICNLNIMPNTCADIFVMLNTLSKNERIYNLATDEVLSFTCELSQSVEQLRGEFEATVSSVESVIERINEYTNKLFCFADAREKGRNMRRAEMRALTSAFLLSFE